MLLPRENRSIKIRCYDCGKEINKSWQDGDLTNGEYAEDGRALCFDCYRKYKEKQDEQV